MTVRISDPLRGILLTISNSHMSTSIHELSSRTHCTQSRNAVGDIKQHRSPSANWIWSGIHLIWSAMRFSSTSVKECSQRTLMEASSVTSSCTTVRWSGCAARSPCSSAAASGLRQVATTLQRRRRLRPVTRSRARASTARCFKVVSTGYATPQ